MTKAPWPIHEKLVTIQQAAAILITTEGRIHRMLFEHKHRFGPKRWARRNHTNVRLLSEDDMRVLAELFPIRVK